MLYRPVRTTWLTLGVVVTALAVSAAADTARVFVKSNGIFPARVSIHPGDSITWLHLEGTHRLVNSASGTPLGTLFDFTLDTGNTAHTETFEEPLAAEYLDQYGDLPENPSEKDGFITVAPHRFLPGAPGWLNTNYVANGEHSEVSLVATPDGTWVAAWLGLIGTSAQDVFVSRSIDGGHTWSTPKDVSVYGVTDNAAEERPDIAVNANGDLVVVWASPQDVGDGVGTDLDIFSATSTDGGQTWSEAVVVNSTAVLDTLAADSNPRVAWADETTVAVVWNCDFNLGGTAGSDQDIFVAVSTDGGDSYEDVQRINNSSSSLDDVRPAIVSNGSRLVVAWEELGDDTDLFCAYSNNNGATWSTEYQVNRNGFEDDGDDTDVALAYAGEDGWIAVWRSTEDFEGMTGTNADIFYATSLNGYIWSNPLPLSPRAYENQEFDEAPPRLAANVERGIALVTWAAVDGEESVHGPDSDILLASSTDRGRSWAPSYAFNASASQDAAGDEETAPAAGIADDGTVLGAWSTTSDRDGAGIISGSKGHCREINCYSVALAGT